MRSRLTANATPLRCRLATVAGADEHELEVEQLVERQPAPAPLRLVRRSRAGAPRGARRAAAAGRATRRSGSGSTSSDSAISASRCRSISDADDLVAQPFGGGIDRQHLARGQRIGLAVGIGQDHELARRHLPAVIEPDRPRDQQRLPDGDGAVEKRLARPDALEHAAVVPQHRVEDPEPAPGRQHALGHHPPDAGDLLADLAPWPSGVTVEAST